MKKYLALFIVFISITSVFYGCQVKNQKKEEPKTGQEHKMPSFTLLSIDGTTINSEQFKGKVLLIDFWATWCPPCREAIPHLIELKKEYKDKDFDIIGISLDGSDKIDKVKKFASDIGINYIVCMGTESVENDFGGIPAIPTIFLIDKNGNIINKWIGFEQNVANKITGEVEKQLQSGS
jgi:thiol-disulfide isomerase/thioredoxin